MDGRTMENKTGCLVCGKELIYSKVPADMVCFYCHETHPTQAKCKEGHYICDKCHSLGALDIIETTCIESWLEDPIQLAVALMRNPTVKMHGPEHHFLVPAVLLAVYYNIKKDKTTKAQKIKVARKRAQNILGGFCGFYGNCGAAVGTGIFTSLVTEATPLSKKEWQLCNLMTSKSLQTIAMNGGPRCCKRNTYLAIGEAVKFMKKELGMKIKTPQKIQCEFSPLNNECLKSECPFYQKRTKSSN